MKPRHLLASLLAAALCAMAFPAAAELTRDDAAAVAQRESGGRVLAVERVDNAGRVVWRVKVLTARGDVRVLLIDAASGQLQ